MTRRTAFPAATLASVNQVVGLIGLLAVGNAAYGVGLGQKARPYVDEEIIVTGERLPGSPTARGAAAARQNLERVPGAIGFVEAEEFADEFAQSIGDTLVFTPGVFADTSAQRENRISVRGSGLNSSFERRGISLYRDGVPITRASGSTEFQEVDPVSIQYIEVHKGANGIRYGGTALGGVINMVTPTGRTAAETVSVRLEGGSFDSMRGSVAVAQAWNTVDIYAAYTRLDAEGYRDHGAVDSHYAFANVGVQLSNRVENRTYVTYLQDHFDLSGSLTLADALEDAALAGRPVQIGPFFPGGPVTVLDPGPVVDDWDRNLDVVRLSNITVAEFDTWSFSGGGWYSNRKLDHAITRFAGIIDQSEDEGGLFVRAVGELGVRQRQGRWTVGIEANKAWNEARTWANVNGRRGALRTKSDQDSWNTLVYAQVDLPVTDTITAILGLQAARTSRKNTAILNDTSGRITETQVNPRLGVMWTPAESVTFFANVTRGFEPASMADLTAGGALDFTPLDAQSAWTFEAGGRGQAGMFSWDIALYRSEITDELLDFGVPSGFSFISFTDNAEDTVHQGLELGIDLQLFESTLAVRGLSLLWRHIYTYNDFAFDGDDTYGNNDLAGVPEQLYVSELRLDGAGGWYVGVNVRVVPDGPWVDFANTTQVPGYTLWGMTAGWDLTDQVRLFLSGENLTDKAYISNIGTNANQSRERASLFTPGQGRAWFGGISVRI